ncbi:MAG: short-chain dehydrogenase/reductase [Caulobacteraceae bacterium]|nr:short-chain dehydrogenase/reductase [Caulobacteraceae bacterium]
MDMNLTGRVALVTGASSGFGEAIAETFARAGAKVALAARRKDRLDAVAGRITAAGGEALVIEADFTREADAQRAVAEAEARFGQLDILVNNAGVMFLEPVRTADLKRWRNMFEVNLLGLIAASQAALPGMLGRKDGHIVNISSTAGHYTAANMAAYGATKAGLISFSDSLRKEVHKEGVRVTVISPGLAATELRDHIGDKNVQAALNAQANAIQQLQAQDIADAILYAVSRPARVNISEILMRPAEQER